MASPFRHGPSAFSDPDSSSRSASSASQRYSSSQASASNGRGASHANFYTHPSRTSLLASTGAIAPETNGNSERAAALEMDYAPLSSSLEWEAGSHPPREPLPSFSRAFNMFALNDGGEGSAVDPGERFFVPSYLAGSKYVKELETVHRSKQQAQKDSKRAAASGVDNGMSGLSSGTLPPGSHRGMAHTIIERPSGFDDDDPDALPPLPTCWNREDAWGGIEIGSDGSSVEYTEARGHHEREHEAFAVRANHYMPPQCGIYYYEVYILNGKRDDTYISVGFSTSKASLSRPIGWEPESWGFHADDGRVFTAQNVGKAYGPSYGKGDVIGCGVNFRNHTAFFTKNGAKLGVAFHDVTKSKLYPAVSLKRPGELVKVNFGQHPFEYNIDDMMRDEQAKIQKQIDKADTSQLEPGMSETDLVQALVLQFLQHDGYVETARAFAEDLRVQKEALNLSPDAEISGVSIKDDEDANNRQRIRRAILEGDIDRALKLTNAYYPQVLRNNEQVYFRLRCRRFIEMVRRAAQLNIMADAKKSNGHVSDASMQDMDVDINGNDAANANVETMDVDGRPMELMELEREMLEYGQALQAEYANDSRRQFSKALNDIWALVAYKNPLKEPQVSHLLDKEGRLAVSEELNSAILKSLGKSSRAALEKVYAQTSVLLEDLRQEGGDGAFVSVQDVVEGIPRSMDL